MVDGKDLDVCTIDDRDNLNIIDYFTETAVNEFFQRVNTSRELKSWFVNPRHWKLSQVRSNFTDDEFKMLVSAKKMLDQNDKFYANSSRYGKEYLEEVQFGDGRGFKNFKKEDQLKLQLWAFETGLLGMLKHNFPELLD